MTIGNEAYCNILNNYNCFLANRASIPIENLYPSTLNIAINVNTSNGKEDISFHKLLLCTLWCMQVEKMETRLGRSFWLP